MYRCLVAIPMPFQQHNRRHPDTSDPMLLHKWRKLQTSDHFYYMCTKWFNDGDVHKYFNPYDSPYDAFISYMNVLQDLEMEVNDILKERGFLKNGEIVNNKISL